MTDLKPCPFCGSGEHDDDTGLVDGMGRDGLTIWVRCLGCGGEGPPVEYTVEDEATSVVTSWPRAVAAWNRRAAEEKGE